MFSAHRPWPQLQVHAPAWGVTPRPLAKRLHSKAREVTKLAGQVNESFYSEVKVARLQMDMEKEVHKLGSLPVNK